MHADLFQGLSTLTKLKTLSIQANRITSLEGLKELPQLEELYISDNLLTSLEPLSYAPNIRILDVQNNPITSLRGVSALIYIENLWATSCKLERFDELEKELGDKKELSEVYFEGNPLQKSNPVLYRNKVRLALPQVSKIDASKYSIPVHLSHNADFSSLCESLRSWSLVTMRAIHDSTYFSNHTHSSNYCCSRKTQLSGTVIA
jgi:Leucine-rich repeat (LRR) protein